MALGLGSEEGNKDLLQLRRRYPYSSVFDLDQGPRLSCLVSLTSSANVNQPLRVFLGNSLSSITHQVQNCLAQHSFISADHKRFAWQVLTTYALWSVADYELNIAFLKKRQKLGGAFRNQFCE